MKFGLLSWNEGLKTSDATADDKGMDVMCAYKTKNEQK